LRNFSVGTETLGQDVSLRDADVGKAFGFQPALAPADNSRENAEATSNEASLGAVDNADVLLKPAGWVTLAVKAQNIDVTKDPLAVYKQEAAVLKNRGFIKELCVWSLTTRRTP
jgi:hypothetical protein